MADEALIILILLLLITGGQSKVTFNYKNQSIDSVWLGAIPSIGDTDPEYTPGTSKIFQTQNVSVRIQPVGGSLVDGTGPCPVVDCCAKDKNGQYVGCYSACGAYKDPRYCCIGTYGSSVACQSNEYSNTFKKACNRAHTYPSDNQPPIHHCTRATS
ncbi:thaumatin-like protein 1 [Fagus crenata]